MVQFTSWLDSEKRTVWGLKGPITELQPNSLPVSVHRNDGKILAMFPGAIRTVNEDQIVTELHPIHNETWRYRRFTPGC